MICEAGQNTPSGPKILIVGASARAAAFSALRAGLAPICIDQYADSDLAAATETRQVDCMVESLPDLMPLYSGIPILYTSSVRRLATERAASWLSKHFTYWWLEKNGHGRVLIDSDEL